MPAKTTTAFEHETCPRCGGSGRYSFNLMHGSMCYGCQGRGWRYTKRGAEASRFFAESLRVPATEIKPGDTIRTDGLPGFEASRWLQVLRVEERVGSWTVNRETGERTDHLSIQISGVARRPGAKEWRLDTVERYGMGVPPESLVRIKHTDEERIAKLNAALDYQATLTKMGKPRKRAAV
jgi:hypothetical protein